MFIFLGLGAGIRCPGCEKPFVIQCCGGVVEKSSADQEMLNAAIQGSNNVLFSLMDFFILRRFVL